MNTHNKKSPRKVQAILERMDALGELIPGSLAKLSEMGSDIAAPFECLEGLIGFLVDEGRVYLTGRGKAALSKTPIAQFVLERMPLRTGSASELYGELAAELAEFSVPYQARLVMEHLRHPGMKHHFADAGPPSDGERRTRVLLHIFRHSFRDDLDLNDLAKRWAEELACLPFHRACQRIARRLEDAGTAAGLTTGGGPLSFDSADPIFKPMARHEEVEVMNRLIGEVEELRAEPARAIARLKEELASMRRKLNAAEAQGRGDEERLRDREANLARR